MILDKVVILRNVVRRTNDRLTVDTGLLHIRITPCSVRIYYNNIDMDTIIQKSCNNIIIWHVPNVNVITR